MNSDGSVVLFDPYFILAWPFYVIIAGFVVIWLGALIYCFIPVKQPAERRDHNAGDLPPALSGEPYIDWPPTPGP